MGTPYTGRALGGTLTYEQTGIQYDQAGYFYDSVGNPQYSSRPARTTSYTGRSTARTLTQGSPMGLLLALTYPTTTQITGISTLYTPRTQP